MRETIKVINRMIKKGLFNDYAIGGGIATMFYIEPFLTYDIDIFNYRSRVSDCNTFTAGQKER